MSSQTHVTVKVFVPGWGVGVPQPDGVVGGAGEEGGRRQTGQRGVCQLWIYLKRRGMRVSHKFTKEPKCSKPVLIGALRLNKGGYYFSFKKLEENFA